MELVLEPKKQTFKIKELILIISFISSFISLTLFAFIEIESLFIKLLLVTPIATLINLALFTPFQNKISKIYQGLKKFRENKNETYRLEISSPQELHELNKEILALSAFANLAKQELEKQGAERKELLVNAAHDIKGPLAVVSGYLEDSLKKLKIQDLDGAKESLEICLKNNKYLEKIVSEIFEASKYDNLSGNLILEVCAIDEFLSDILSKYQAHISQNNLNILFKPNSNNALLQIDLGMIERAISNLIENAIKFTANGGSITLGSNRHEDKILIYISDTGKGIAEKDLAQIFDRRFKEDRSKDAKGSGLGLNIVKKIIEAHKGEIICNSTQGAGSVFQITLPCLEKDKISEAMAEMISRKA